MNGYDIEEVALKFKQLIPYEVETWAYSQIACTYLFSPKALAMIDCGQDEKTINYSFENGEELLASLPSKEEAAKQPERKPLYESQKMCNGELLYVRYRACSNMKDYPFEKFVEDISKDYGEKLPKACLVDVRFNTGGSDVVIRPLVRWLRENNIKTYMLMNERTMSSGVFALASFKKELNATLIGTDAAQPTAHYGNLRWVDMEGKSFSYCERYFELTSCHDENAPVKPYCIIDAFDYLGIIKPDIYIENRVEDFNNDIDTQLSESIKIIKKEFER